MTGSGGPAIAVRGLRKAYGGRPALDGLDLTVPYGTVRAVLGPNGAGKTTCVRILSTLLRPDGGRAEVAGYDVAREPREVRRRIGLLGQHAAVDEGLSGWQNLEMFGRLHHLGARRAAARAGELLERFGLADTGRRPVGQYSGGMRRRLDLAASLITSPRVLFLDEPTTGLDPRGRAEVWEAVRSLVGGGTAVLLTTQYLEEADQLADRICVVDQGRAVADGTADELKTRFGGDRLDVVLRDAARLAEAASVVGMAARAGAVEADADRRRVSVPVADRIGALTGVVRALQAAGIEAEDIALRRPTLDEVFLRVTEGGGAAPQDRTGGTGGPADRTAPADHAGRTGRTDRASRTAAASHATAKETSA
ncbi:ATP-binding cassette domain-containing protein [Streptomyces sp. B1866]|uniref:ATP-binding cassette domain-containing protein n=1 Tax=Streptomyces sp. B1866 TaxID=3075431 RepID=UPI00288F30F8|nr:ATP-binding cassette domain-containing protein [Streptomyces sp. B1866]MDT3396483.1 ATP-binding cassette domain-containing protein [Streptomyces sp. B1866]